MTGYYPYTSDGDLLYGSTARAVAVSYPGMSIRQAAKYFFGEKIYSFGGFFPNRCDRLIENVPQVSRITKEVVVNGSPYHLVAPLLNEEQRATLLEGMFSAKRWVSRNYARKRGKRKVALAYCLPCAQRDHREGRPKVWRVIHNHCGCSCCYEHGCRLTVTEAVIDGRSMRDPWHWIDLSVAMKEQATLEEFTVAQDIAWLYAQKSSCCPGAEKLNIALRNVLLEHSDYQQGSGLISRKNIIRDLRARMPIAVKNLDPDLCDENRFKLTIRSVHPLQRYCLLAQLVNLRLKDLFQRAANLSSEPVVTVDRKKQRHDTIALAKTKFAELVEKFPKANRKQLLGLDPYHVGLVCREAFEYYEKIAPMPSFRGQVICEDWPARDDEMVNLISSRNWAEGSRPKTIRSILFRLGLKDDLIKRAYGRLPKTEKLLWSIILERGGCR